MPTYEFKNNETDEVFEKIMSYDDKVKYLEENPHIQSYYSKMNIDHDGGQSVLSRAGSGWKEVQDRIEAELRIKAKEEQRLRDLEKEMEKQRTGQHMASDESPDDENWIQEQNKLAEKRNLTRLAREEENQQKELKDSTNNSERKSKLANLIEKASGSSFEGMTADEAEMVRKARLNEPTQQRQIQEKEKEEKVNSVSPSAKEDWYAEQNRLVEERRKARLAKEGEKE